MTRSLVNINDDGILSDLTFVLLRWMGTRRFVISGVYLIFLKGKWIRLYLNFLGCIALFFVLFAN